MLRRCVSRALPAGADQQHARSGLCLHRVPPNLSLARLLVTIVGHDCWTVAAVQCHVRASARYILGYPRDFRNFGTYMAGCRRCSPLHLALLVTGLVKCLATGLLFVVILVIVIVYPPQACRCFLYSDVRRIGCQACGALCMRRYRWQGSVGVPLGSWVLCLELPR